MRTRDVRMISKPYVRTPVRVRNYNIPVRVEGSAGCEDQLRPHTYNTGMSHTVTGTSHTQLLSFGWENL